MNVKYLVVHCSDSPNNKEFTAEDIHAWHKQRGWAGIGYHAVIRRNGMIDRGRPLYWWGAHVREHNNESLGVCLIGRDTFTDEQYYSLHSLLREWLDDYPDAQVVGHGDLDSKKAFCPGFGVRAWWAKAQYE